MGTIISFPADRLPSDQRLSPSECDAIYTRALAMMTTGKATGVSYHEQKRYMGVFDGAGQLHMIGRGSDGCYLMGPGKQLIVRGMPIAQLLDALEGMCARSTSPRFIGGFPLKVSCIPENPSNS